MACRVVMETLKDLEQINEKRKRLIDLDLFVLDNSLRETTVGQLRGHTLEDKWKIYDEVKKVGFDHAIVTSFSHMTRVGDAFIEQMYAKGEDMTNKYAFSELSDKSVDGIPVQELPIGLVKCQKLKILNPIIEIDFVYHAIDYEKFTHQKYCQLIDERIRWVRQNISQDSKIFFNLRDLTMAMMKVPERVINIVTYLASYQPPIFGLLTEDMGGTFPEEMGVYVKAVRNEMNRCDFQGHLLVHIHQQWGLSEQVVLECLLNGANGIWAGLCEEGAAVGHASSLVAILNLIRLGNTKVRKAYNCQEMRSAGIRMTEAVTGMPPHPKQIVLGKRAVDQVFGLPPVDPEAKEKFSLSKFFGEEPERRISTLATNKMIKARLEKLFGEDGQFTLEMGTKMRELMLEDLRDNRKEEYHSPVGLAVLFDRAGGRMTEPMCKVLDDYEPKSLYIVGLIKEIRKHWDEWDLRDGQKDDFLDFDSFYNGFMAPYFGCHRCEDTRMALRAIDMDKDERVDWNEFEVYLKWAGKQYPDVESAEKLLETAFRKGLIPAMQDAVIEKQETNENCNII